MYLVDYEKDLASERVVCEDPVPVLREILDDAPEYRQLVVRIERVSVKRGAFREAVAGVSP